MDERLNLGTNVQLCCLQGGDNFEPCIIKILVVGFSSLLYEHDKKAQFSACK